MNRNCTVATTMLAASLLFGVGHAYAQIYKTVDEDGNVVFTDVAPKDQTEAIVVDPHNTYSPVSSDSAPTRGSRNAIAEDESEGEPAAMYDQLAIASPQHDEPVRENAGNVTVVVTSNPPLDSGRGHILQILVDGELMGAGSSNSVALTNIDRGTHQLSARIVDSEGQVMASSSPITFHMLRYSALMRRKQGS